MNSATIERVSELFPATLSISVTDEDIRNGVACDSKACPIALAFIRAVEKCGLVPTSITVGPGTAYIYMKADGPIYDGLDIFDRVCIRYTLPPEAAEFIYNFDSHQFPDAFTFDAVKSGTD